MTPRQKITVTGMIILPVANWIFATLAISCCESPGDGTIDAR